MALLGPPLAVAAPTTLPAAGGEQEPVAPVVREIAVPTVAPSRQTGQDGDGPVLVAASGPQEVSGYAVVGVTWRRNGPGGDLELSVQTRTGTSWSRWQPLPYDEDHGPDPGTAEAREARAGTDPLVLGDVDAVRLQVRSAGGEVPQGLRLALVDPGTGPGDAAVGAPARSAGGPTPRPAIYSRAQWGADESLRSGTPSYGEVFAGFVHHTVNANDYGTADVPAILRGIYAYHTQSRGWSDIGYNYLVDRFGRIWEGRYGGVDRPVIGAHTLGYNDDAFAMSAIGNFDLTSPPQVMLDAYARLYAWKLGLHGIRPQSHQSLDGDRFPAINGHRDAAQTACPGTYLYAQLPQIRAAAADRQQLFAGRDPDRDLAGSPQPDLLVRNAETSGVRLVEGGRGFRFGRRQVVRENAERFDLLTGVYDVDGDGRPDLLARNGKSGAARVFPGDGAGGFTRPYPRLRRFADADLLQGVGDLTGDGRPDVVARRAGTGSLVLHRGRGEAQFGPAQALLEDASAYDAIVGAGDLDRDGRRDLLGRTRSGALHLLRPAATDGDGSASVVATGWSGKTLLAGGRDVTGDGRPDLIARDSATGATWIYVTDEQGRFVHRLGGWTSWTGLDRLTMVGDVTGDGLADVAGRDRRDRLVVMRGTGARWLHAPVRTRQVLPGADLVLAVGDWDGDGHPDAMSRARATGALRLHRGRGTGRLSDPVAVWPGWGEHRWVVAPGDVSGDGDPDLMTQDAATGAVYLHPNDGSGGFRAPWIMRSGILDADLVAAVGRWDADGSPDLVVRERATGDAWLYPVNGPGGLVDPVPLGADLSAYDVLLGAGDLDRDGHLDLLARHATSGAAYLLPGTRTGLGSRRYLGASLERFDLLG